MQRKLAYLLLSTAVGVISAAAPAWALADDAAGSAPGGNPGGQAAAKKAKSLEAQSLSEIVVTGTLIRGVAPTGTETLTLSGELIREAPGLSTDDVLATVPQVTNFYNQQVSLSTGAGSALGVNSPEIHGLPTLIMLDSHRMASAGTFTTSIDPSIIPKGVLQGIEVVPDGGSSLYGSDAVGGVINMTTKKRFDGVDVDANVGLADHYQSYRFDGMAGKEWDTGSVYVAYAYSKQTPLLGGDRPYIHYIGPLSCVPTTIQPSALEVIPGFGTFSVPLGVSYTPSGVGANGKPTGFNAGGATSCNEYTNEDVSPEQHMHSVFAGLSQELSPTLKVDVRAYYSTRSSTSANVFNELERSVNVPQGNYYYTPTPIEQSIPGFTGSQGAAFSLSPAVGPNNPSTYRLDTWGGSSEFKQDLGSNFQARLLLNYSRSYVRSVTTGIDSGLLATSLASGDLATALDPYDVAATPQSAAVARQIFGQKTTTYGHTDELQLRLVTDGTLFHLPGGDVKIAAGGELLHEGFASFEQQLTYNGSLYQPNQSSVASRTVASAFGELDIPVISADNHVPFVYGLNLSVSGRYDRYSDFGGTLNPRYAASLMPTDWLTVRATYGHSFVAPELTQEMQVQTGNLISAFSFLLPPGDTQDIGRNMIIVTGGNPNLQPQTATTWSLGGDAKVPFIEGLKAGITYYNAQYFGQIETVPFTNASLFYSGLYSKELLRNPTYAQAAALIGNASVSGGTTTMLSQLYGPGGAITANSPAFVIDARFQNLGVTNTSGLDMNVGYRRPTSFGAVDFGVAANYVLTNLASGGPGQPFVDQTSTNPRFFGSLSAGANVGAFRITAVVTHTGGYSLLPGSSPYGQQGVDPYDAVNTFLGYTFKGHGPMGGAEISLAINNVLDARPAVNTSSTFGYDKESVIGRTFQLGVHKKF